MKSALVVSSVVFLSTCLACGGVASPVGDPIPAVVDGVPQWVDASGVPFSDVPLTAFEPQSSGTAVAYATDRGWVLVDLDARPVAVTDAPCDPQADLPSDCGLERAGLPLERGERSCTFEVRDTGMVESVAGPSRSDGTRVMVDQPVRDVWLVSASGVEHRLPRETTERDCLGELAIAAVEPFGALGLFQGETVVHAPFASQRFFLTEDRVLLRGDDSAAWQLFNEQGERLIDGLQEVGTDRRILDLWHVGLDRFPQSTEGFAAVKDGSCGWIGFDGEVLGGFEPGFTACSAPADGHGFVKVGDAYRWVELAGGS